MHKELQSIAIKDASGYGYNTLKVSLSYDKGEVNMMSDYLPRRGYVLTVIPHTVEDGFRKTKAYDGSKKFIEETKRFNAKRFDALGKELLQGKDGVLNHVKAFVMEKNGFTLE